MTITFDSVVQSLPLPIADIPPPPPEIPWVNASVPHPLTVIVAGLCLALAAIFLGVLRHRNTDRGRPTSAIAVSMGIVLLTCAAAFWAKGRWADHRSSIERWEPNGPVPDRLADLPSEGI